MECLCMERCIVDREDEFSDTPIDRTDYISRPLVVSSPYARYITLHYILHVTYYIKLHVALNPALDHPSIWRNVARSTSVDA